MPGIMNWSWTWSWITPHPAHLWDNPIADVIRILCVVLTAILMMYIARLIVEASRREVPTPRPQLAVIIALGLGSLSIALTEAAVVGSIATPRLLVNVICLTLGTVGVYGMRVKQKMIPIREDAR